MKIDEDTVKKINMDKLTDITAIAYDFYCRGLCLSIPQTSDYLGVIQELFGKDKVTGILNDACKKSGNLDGFCPIEDLAFALTQLLGEAVERSNEENNRNILNKSERKTNGEPRKKIKTNTGEML